MHRTQLDIWRNGRVIARVRKEHEDPQWRPSLIMMLLELIELVRAELGPAVRWECEPGASAPLPNGWTRRAQLIDGGVPIGEARLELRTYEVPEHLRTRARCYCGCGKPWTTGCARASARER